MKLHRRTFQVFWDVHAWAGVVSALLLYVMFFAGAFALFHPELNEWAEPRSAAPAHSAPRLQPLFEQLVREERALGSRSVGFSIHDTSVTARVRGTGQNRQFHYSHETHRLESQKTDLGSFLYRLHYLGPIPNGIYVAGLAASAMFLALVTGVSIHLKDLVRQWFQFRPRHYTRTWSSDMHKVLGVLGLPFQLLFAWSGAVLCLTWVIVEPSFVATVFRGNEAASAAAHGYAEAQKPRGELATNRADLDVLRAEARRVVPGFSPEYVSIEHAGDRASVVAMYGEEPGVSFGNVELAFLASDGSVRSRSTASSATTLQRFEAWLFGLHYAHLGGYAVKWLYASLAMATCAVIVTGNLVWLERRDRKRAHFGNRLLQRLTVGFCSGLPVAIAALFLSNRVLPADLQARVALEQTVFWLVWGLALIWPFIERSDRRVASRQLVLSAATFAGALGLDLVKRQPFLADPTQRGVASALLLLTGLCGGAGLWLHRGGALPKPKEAVPKNDVEAFVDAE